MASAGSLMAALDGRGVSAQVSIPSDVYILLDSLQVVSPSPLPAAGPVQGGEVTPAPNLSLLGFATFAFDPGLGSIHLDLTSDANSFTVDLNPPALALPASLVPARFAGDADGGHLEALPGTAHVVFTDAVAIRVSGSQNTPATVRLVLAGQDDVVASVSLQGADGVLFGTSGFGLRLPNGLVLDDSGTQVPPPATAPHDAPFASEAPEWRGIAIRGATLFLPAQTPLLGSAPIGIDFELGSPRGLDARIQVAVPAQTPRPAFKADIEWHDPTATSLGQALPTLLELTTEVTVVGQSAKEPVSGQAVTLAGGKPLRLRGRFSRDPQTEALGFDLSVEGVGAEGLIAVSAESGDTAAKVFVTAAALATALVADSQQPSPAFADGSGVALHFLLLAAAALSSYAHSGQVVVHGVEVGGDVRALGDQVHLRVDYSVDVVVTTISLGVISVEMNPEVPLRIRYRDVALVLNLPFQGVDSFNVSFHEASVDVEDPGGWIVNSPGSVLDVIGTRSGHGSSWFEVDLRFALDLGLVKVSGATIRAFFGSGLVPKPSLRGLDAQLNLPAFITGEGLAQFTPDGLDIGLAVRLPALGLGAMGFVGYQDQGQFREVLV
ncbi:MAG: hypothetical protein JOY61_16225, partial [Chloroflexi bacterium]|nr:hypothetical protein [Chloroflexota bacterium]